MLTVIKIPNEPYKTYLEYICVDTKSVLYRKKLLGLSDVDISKFLEIENNKSDYSVYIPIITKSTKDLLDIAYLKEPSTIEHDGWLIWNGLEDACFRIDKLFTRREVVEMRFRIDTLDDFLMYQNIFYKRASKKFYIPCDIMVNGDYLSILEKDKC